MHDGSIIFSTALDNAQLEKDLAGLTKKIEKQEQKIAELSSKRDKAREKGLFDAETLDREKAKLQEIKDRLADIRAMAKDKGRSQGQREGYAAQIPTIQQELKDQQTRVNALQAEWSKTQNAAERYAAQLSEAEGILDRQKAEAGDLVRQIEEANGGAAQMARAADRAGAHMAKLTQRMKGILASAFIFNIVSAGLRQFTVWVGKSIKANSEARQSIAQLKGALLTLAQPLVEVIIPAFTMLVNVLARVVTAAAQLVSMLFGKTLKQSKDGAKALYEEAGGIEAVGGAAKEAMGSLAGFDEINTINTENAGGAGGGGGASADIAPDFSWADDMGGMLDRLKEIADLVGLIAAGLALWKLSGMLPGVLGTIAQKLAGLLLTVGGLLLYWHGLTDAWENGVDWLNLIEMIGGLAVAALGLYLLFGPIAAGIALIVGGIGMLVTAFHDAMKNGWNLQNTLLAIAGLLAAGLGIAMLTGSWIPLLIAAVAGIAVAIIANWDTIQQFLEGTVGFVVALLSGAVLMLGAILLFSGANIGLGLGLLALGAVGLAAALAANWDTVWQALEGPVGTVTALISSALLVLGAVLLFSGAAVPLGIGLMAAGAVGLVTAIAANWSTVQTALRSPVSAITALISGALLVLGVILLFTGAAIPLGLGLIGAGAIGLASTIAPNWDFVLDAIMGAWRDVKNWWKANAEKFFTLDYWKNLGKDIIDGFLDGLKKAWGGLASWFGGVWDSLFGNRKVSVGVSGTSSAGNYNTAPRVMYSSVPNISTDKIPRLAKGAVIPPNREFMAVLGDQLSGNNLEAPEDLIRKIVREESGGGSAELIQLLQAILSAVKSGHVIMVDGSVFGRTAIKTINSVTTSAGKQLLLI